MLWTRVRADATRLLRPLGRSEHAAAAGVAVWTRRTRLAPVPSAGRQVLLPAASSTQPGASISPPTHPSALSPRKALLKGQHQELTFTTSLSHLIVVSLLDEKCFSVISQFHVQIHRLPIDFYVHLKENILLHNRKSHGGGGRAHSHTLTHSDHFHPKETSRVLLSGGQPGPPGSSTSSNGVRSPPRPLLHPGRAHDGPSE